MKRAPKAGTAGEIRGNALPRNVKIVPSETLFIRRIPKTREEVFYPWIIALVIGYLAIVKKQYLGFILT